jgi:hypothetical protein
MSAPQLPEDLNQWPSDSYELLGVRPGVGPRELRRAYTQIIRKFKPEQFPEHFRRIREAYETVLRWVEFQQMLHGANAEQEDVLKPAEPSSPAPAETSIPETIEVMPRPWMPAAPTSNELDELWQRACAGEEAAVYRRLVELHEQRPGNQDVCVRLYWLLALSPELEPRRSPCDWLVQGLTANGFQGTLRELYRRELAEDSHEAISDRCTRVFRQVSSPGQLVDLAEWRWQAAVRLGHWQRIDDDLEYLHGQLARDEDETWVRLLISASEHLAALEGEGPHDLIKECLKQIKRYDHLHTRLADSLDRLDFLLEVANGLRKLRRQALAPQTFLLTVSASWTHPFHDVRPLLLEYLAQAAKYPDLALSHFDDIHAAAAPVLGQFGNLLSLLAGTIADDDPARLYQQDFETVVPAIHEFLGEHGHYTYKRLRTTLLQFCLREMVSPEKVAELSRDDNLIQAVNNDGPVRYVYEACRLFWA